MEKLAGAILSILLIAAGLALLLLTVYWPIADWRRRGVDGHFPYEDYRFWKILFIVGFLTGMIMLVGVGYLLLVARPTRGRADASPP